MARKKGEPKEPVVVDPNKTAKLLYHGTPAIGGIMGGPWRVDIEPSKEAMIADLNSCYQFAIKCGVGKKAILPADETSRKRWTTEYFAKYKR